jgi:membrane dipeptidase
MISAEAQAVHDQALIIDLHCDLLLTDFFLGWDWRRRHRNNPLPGAALMGHCDLPRFQEGNVGCLALGVVVSPLRRASGPAAIRADLEKMHRRADESPEVLAVACSAQGIRTARERGRIACFAGLEGAHGLNGRLDDLAGFREQGLGYVGLAHFTANQACRPMVGLGSSQTVGLTDFGRALVDELNRVGIVVDVAHVNKPGVLEVCARSKAPVICSHTACTAVHKSPRGVDDEQVRAIAGTGGVIGVIFVTPFIGPGGVEAVVAHLEHIRRLVGVEHCAIGTDWEGWAVYPDGLDSAEKLPLLTEALLRRGWSAEDIFAAYGGNFLRVMQAAQA